MFILMSMETSTPVPYWSGLPFVEFLEWFYDTAKIKKMRKGG